MAKCLFTFCLAAATTGSARLAVAQVSHTSLTVRGEMVDADTPATYRLPLVGLCDPIDEIRIASNAAVSMRPASEAIPQAASSTTAAALAVPPTTSGLTAQLLPGVKRGYNLAQRGAFFAARTEFIQVLRRVAQAKDAKAGTDEHSRQLAAGLRAMDEADDFVPQGTQLEGELSVRDVASSHRTPVLKDRPEPILPQDAVALYHGFAHEQLAQAAVDEQAGSMALYGLGKVYSQLAERSDDDVQCIRSAMTLYCAALDACPNNNLAANELGVMLCRTGHLAEAVTNFVRAIDIAPTATAYHNLAVAQGRLGLVAQSAANELESQRLLAYDRSVGAISQRAGIEWVSPQELASASQPAPLGPASAPDAATAASQFAPSKHNLR